MPQQGEATYFPQNIPIIDQSTGLISRAWLFFFLALLNRTGGVLGNTASSFNFPVNAGLPGQLLTSQGSGAATFWSSLVVPTKTSELTNNSGYITSSGLEPYATLLNPVFTNARGDTPPVNTNTSQFATTAFVLGQASTGISLPDSLNGTRGNSLLFARQDHSHPFNTAPTFATSVTIGTITIKSGTGVPTGSSVNGSLYSRLDGGLNTTLYIFRSGAWVGIA